MGPRNNRGLVKSAAPRIKAVINGGSRANVVPLNRVGDLADYKSVFMILTSNNDPIVWHIAATLGPQTSQVKAITLINWTFINTRNLPEPVCGKMTKTMRLDST